MTQQIANDAFKAWFNDVLKISMKVTRPHIEEGHQLAPHLMIFEREPRPGKELGHGRMAYVPVNMNNVLEKERAMRLQRALSSNMELVNGVVLVTEAWTLAVERDDKDGLANMRKGIHDHPDKQESVIWSAMRGDMQMMAFAKIERPAIGTPIVHEPDIIDVAVEGLEGRLTGGEKTKAS